MDERRYPSRTAVLSVIALVALAGCSSTPAAPSGPGSNATAAPGATTAPVVTAAPTVAAPTAAQTKALPTVDLVLSGAIAVIAKGTKGQCTLGKDSTGKVVAFGFNAVEADYAGLGQGLYIAGSSNGFVNIKWIVNASTGFLNSAAQKGVSADLHSVTIDVALGPTEHIKGTIACP